MYPELNGKVIVISGAGGGLGASVVKRFAAEKSRLALIDRSEDGLRHVTESLGSSEENLLLGVIDLTAQGEVSLFVENVVARFGRIDALINVAGGFIFSGPVHEMNAADFDTMFSINVKTVALLSAAAAKQMIAAQRGGRIINIGSKAALNGAAGLSAYSASKSAVLRLTESMAAELLPHNITVNAILPSVIDTPGNRKAQPDADPAKWVTPESLADVIAFLASDAARDISGAAIPVYGKS